MAEEILCTNAHRNCNVWARSVWRQDFKSNIFFHAYCHRLLLNRKNLHSAIFLSSIVHERSYSQMYGTVVSGDIEKKIVRRFDLVKRNTNFPIPIFIIYIHTKRIGPWCSTIRR